MDVNVFCDELTQFVSAYYTHITKTKQIYVYIGFSVEELTYIYIY